MASEGLPGRRSRDLWRSDRSLNATRSRYRAKAQQEAIALRVFIAISPSTSSAAATSETTAAAACEAATATGLEAATAAVERALLKIAALHAAGTVLAGSCAIAHAAKGARRTLSCIGRSPFPQIWTLPGRELSGTHALPPGWQLSGARALDRRRRAGLSAARSLRSA